MKHLRRLLWGALPLIVGSTSMWTSSALAEGQPTVAQARQLFAEALKDEEASKFADALAKLQKVQSVRDTSPVRYRIARCTENLGRIAKAREMYLRTVDGTQIPSIEDPSVAAASRESAFRLASRVGYVRIEGLATQGAERLVAVDEDEWAGAGLHEVDPGSHTLRVQNSDNGKSRTIAFVVSSGATSSIRLFHNKPEPIVAPAPVVARKPVEAPRSGSPTPWAWVSLGAGAAFLGGGIVMLAVREGDVGHIEETCPQDRCPTTTRDDIESRQTRARTLGVLGVTGVAVGGVGLAVGAGLLLFGPRSHSSAATRASARWLDRSGVSPLPGGAQIYAGTTF